MWNSLLLCCYRSWGWKMLLLLGRTRNAAAPEAGTPPFGVATTTTATAVAGEGRTTRRRKTTDLKLEVSIVFVHFRGSLSQTEKVFEDETNLVFFK